MMEEIERLMRELEILQAKRKQLLEERKISPIYKLIHLPQRLFHKP